MNRLSFKILKIFKSSEFKLSYKKFTNSAIALKSEDPVGNPEQMPFTQNFSDKPIAEKTESEEQEDKYGSMLKDIARSIVSTKAKSFFNKDNIAEAKRVLKEKREALQKNRLSTSHLKLIYSDKDLNRNLNLVEKREIIKNFAKKYGVDEKCLEDVLHYYRIPPISQRYDGYLVSKAWHDSEE